MCLKECQLRVVPCGNRHCFCVDCLHTLAGFREVGQLPCPICRQPITYTLKGVSSFPIHKLSPNTKPIDLDIKARSSCTVYRPPRAAVQSEHVTGETMEDNRLISRPKSRTDSRNIPQETRQRAQELEERADSFNRRNLPREEYQNTSSGSSRFNPPHAREELRSAHRTTRSRLGSRAGSRYAETSRTPQPIGEDEQLAIRLQQQEFLDVKQWAWPSQAQP